MGEVGCVLQAEGRRMLGRFEVPLLFGVGRWVCKLWSAEGSGIDIAILGSSTRRPRAGKVGRCITRGGIDTVRDKWQRIKFIWLH